MRTPVVLIIFKRPETTARVFAEIAKARPSKLLIVADGPRPDRPGEAEQCTLTRSIVQRVDWECDVLTNFADVNLGCGHRPATGISWAFEQVEEAIILEDDVVPHPTFFRFCEELLEKYRHDERVMHIGGQNELQLDRSPLSYIFSCHNIGIGWATWRRAWKYFDFYVSLWPQLRHSTWLADTLEDARGVAHWQKLFDQAYTLGDNADFWDYQWTFACWAQHGLSICPTVNLVTNIGFGPEATHTLSPRKGLGAFLPTQAMDFPLRHPPNMIPDGEFDRALTHLIVGPKRSAARRARRRVQSFASRTLRYARRQGGVMRRAAVRSTKASP
jgi:hypothetical protein